MNVRLSVFIYVINILPDYQCMCLISLSCVYRDISMSIYIWGVANRGLGVPTPTLFLTWGWPPKKFYYFLKKVKTYQELCISCIYQIKWLKTKEKQNFGVCRFWDYENNPHVKIHGDATDRHAPSVRFLDGCKLPQVVSQCLLCRIACKSR